MLLIRKVNTFHPCCQNIHSRFISSNIKNVQAHHNLSTISSLLLAAHEHARPHWSTLASLLQQTAKQHALLSLRYVHCLIVSYGLERHRVMERQLLQAYGKYLEMHDTLAIFSRIHDVDPVSWNFVIGSCAKHGQSILSLQLFENMLSQGCVPDKHMYASILPSCIGLCSAKLIHARIVATGLEHDLVVATALVSMYGKCNNINHAEMTFQNIQQLDVISVNVMIGTYTQQGNSKAALKMYDFMLHQVGIMPNEVTFVSVMSACAHEEDLIKGSQVHAHIIGAGLTLNKFMASALVNMYGKCGKVFYARSVFDSAPKEDFIIWNAMINAYAHNGYGTDALTIFEIMQREGVRPCKTTFVTVLEGCMNQVAITEAKMIGKLIRQHGYEADTMVATSLLNMYGKYDMLEKAFELFDNLNDRSVVSWNAVIALYARKQCKPAALQVLEQMLNEGMFADKTTFLSFLPICASYAKTTQCKSIHTYIINNNYELDEKIATSIINMYGSVGMLDDAQDVFCTLPNLTVSLWTALISACEQNGKEEQGIKLFYQMLVEGFIPDKVALVSILSGFANRMSLTEGMRLHASAIGGILDSEIDVQNALTMMYGKCGNLDHAIMAFFQMFERNVVSWNGMIAMFMMHGQGIETIDLYWQMLQEGILPNGVTIVSIINVCGIYGTMFQGSKIHVHLLHMLGDEYSDVVTTALINMYANCGSLRDAWKIFETSNLDNILACNAMIDACMFHGKGITALTLFNKMQKKGLTPNKSTYIKLLSACSHIGLVNEAELLIGSLTQNAYYLLTVDHFNCVIDLHGRTGNLLEGQELINKMPFQPNPMTWSTLLGACQITNSVTQGEHATMHMFEIEPENAATYVLLSNIYMAAGKIHACVSDERYHACFG